MARALERRAELAAQALVESQLAEEELEQQRQERDALKAAAAASAEEEGGVRKQRRAHQRYCISDFGLSFLS